MNLALSVLGILFGVIGVIASYLTAKEIHRLKQTHERAYDHLSYLEQAWPLYQHSRQRLIAYLSYWSTDHRILAFLENTNIPNIVFYGVVKRGTMLSRILKRYHINKSRIARNLKTFAIMVKPDFGPKFLIADDNVLIAKRIDVSGSSELSTVFENNLTISKMFADYYQSFIEPRLEPFDQYFARQITEIGLTPSDASLVAEKLLDGEPLDSSITQKEYEECVKFALSQLS
jgi:hypothetical protein